MSENIADTLKCPHCAANLVYDGQRGKSVCKFCGSEFDPNVLRLSFAFEKKDEEDLDEDTGKQEIICNSCGATVITDENTSATFCCYCGSPALAGRRLRKEFKPDFIIPFKLTREQAEEKFMEWGKTNKYIPFDFMDRENINKLTPLYVPFWLVDSKCEANFYGTAYVLDSKSKSEFSIDRHLVFYLKGVPFVGAKKMNRLLMEAVEPFDYSEMVPYNDAYLPGFYAERYNLTPNDMAQNVIWRMESYARQSDDALNTVYDHTDLKEGYIDVSECKYSYVLLPIWFLNYKKDGAYHGFAINGQTGEACGKLPYSKAKRVLAIALTVLKWLVIPMSILIFLQIAFFYKGFVSGSINDYRLGYYLTVTLAWLNVFLMPGVWYLFAKKLRRILKETTNPIDKVPDLSQYYDPSRKATVEQSDDFIMMGSLSDSEKNDIRMHKIKEWIDRHF